MVILNQTETSAVDVSNGYLEIRKDSVYAGCRNALIHLGTYVTPDRAKNILKEIATSISSEVKFYEMPKA